MEAFILKDNHLLAVHFIQNIDKHLLTIAKLFEKVSGCRKSDLKAKSRVILGPILAEKGTAGKDNFSHQKKIALIRIYQKRIEKQF